MALKNKIVLFSTALVLSSTSAFAFDDGSNFSFDNRLVDAVEQNNVEIVDAILSTGEDPNITGKFDTSALHRAAFHGNYEILKMLIDAGADVNMADYGGASPLHIAARTGNKDVAEELLKDGADINSVDGQGYTPLHRSITNNQVPVTYALIEKGAEVNTMNNEGDTPLIDAVRISNPDLVKQLIVKGADKTIKNNKGLDAIDYAMKVGNKNIDTMLSRSVQELMRGNSISSETVIASNNSKPAYLNTASSVPEYMKKETEMQTAFADASPFVSQGTGDEYVQSMKVPVADVQEEIIDVPPVALQETTPEKQIENRYQFAEIEQQKYQSAPVMEAEEADLQKAPRMPDDGRLPKSLRADFLKAQQQQQIAEATQAAKNQMKEIELPKEVSDIEYSSSTIQLPQETEAEGSREAEPLMATSFEELPEPVEEKAAEVSAPAYIAQEDQKENLPELIQVAQNHAVFPAVEPASDVPASLLQAKRIEVQTAPTQPNIPAGNMVTTPVDSMQVISSSSTNAEGFAATPAIVQAPAPVIQAPASNPVAQPVVAEPKAEQIFYDANYAKEVDALMQSYIAEPSNFDTGYVSEVDALMNQAITGIEVPQQIAPQYQPPSFPASLAMKQAVKDLNLSKDANTYVQQNMQTTDYTSEPIYSATKETITRNLMPKVPTADVEETVIYQAETEPVMKKSGNSNYNAYRSSLIKDINEFYNKDYQGFGKYDISDLEKQRTTNLGISPAPAKALNPSETVEPKAAPAANLSTDDTFLDNDEPKAEYDSGADIIAVPETKVEVEEMETLPAQELKEEPVVVAPEPKEEAVVDVTPEEVMEEVKKEEEKSEKNTVKDINIDELLEAPAN